MTGAVRTSDPAKFLNGLVAIVGPAGVMTAPADMAPHLREWRDLYQGVARAIVKPANVQQVSAVVLHCVAHGVAIVPQGGNTGLVGGQIPTADIDAIVLCLTRMDKVRSVEPLADAMIVEAGVTLAGVQAEAEAAGRHFPLSLASEGSCTIGGNIATNAGGTAVLAYGNMRDLVLGLEVVLPDGRIWNGLSTLRKDNTGYDLKHLFVGSEGTLGIVTAAALKLFPAIRTRATAFIAVPSPDAALHLLGRLKAGTGGTLATFELMPRFGIDVVLRHAPGARDPLSAPSPWYVLAEITSPAEADLDTGLASALEAAMEAGEVTDAALAGSLDQRSDFWRLREAMSEVQRLEGGSIKHDVSVPVAEVPAFIHAATRAVLRLIPDARPLPFGHLGDGNIHFNISQPVGTDKAAFLARWDEVNEVVHGVVTAFHGSVSAEHGIGRLKQKILGRTKDPVALALMSVLKDAFDPEHILNPGAVLDQR